MADKQDASRKLVTLDSFEGFCSSQKPAEQENATDRQRGAENETASAKDVAGSQFDMNAMVATLNSVLQQNQLMLQLLNNQSNVKSYNVMPDFSKTISVFNGEDLSKAKAWLSEIEQTPQTYRKPDTQCVTNSVSQKYSPNPSRSQRPSGNNTVKTSRCFNCQEEGHLVKQCTKPKRERGSCFACGDMSHRYKDCPQRKTEEKYVNSSQVHCPTVNYEFKISLVPNHIPSFSRPRRLSQYEKSEVGKIIDELLQHGIIRKSDSEYSSPIVLVPKKNQDTLRMCIDYRNLNKITLRDNFPLPLIEDQLDQLKEKTYFTLLDLKSAFHHITVEPSSVKYTSFVTPMGQYEYLKLPFGLKNSPAAFMRYINLDLGYYFVYKPCSKIEVDLNVSLAELLAI
ncbi:Zinc knuckle [Popillia japonica]|uniref:Zinc knuckle n=1 Tax=Popillia japonica TaxID=7064 RepID=A0AAW1I9C8_POPJA